MSVFLSCLSCVSWFSSLRQRRRQAELMDEPGLDASEHVHALDGLERINRWSGSSRILWPSLRRLAERQSRDGCCAVLDAATGAGDLPIRAPVLRTPGGRSIGHRRLRHQCSGARHHARQQAAAAGAEIGFFALDVLRDPLPAGYDVIVSSLFLHHLEEGQVRRTPPSAWAKQPVGWCSSMICGASPRASRCLPTSAHALCCPRTSFTSMARSVEAAFTIPEVRRLAEDAGLAGATIVRRWPCRFDRRGGRHDRD